MELRKKILTYSESLEISKGDLELVLDELEKKGWLSDDRFLSNLYQQKKENLVLEKLHMSLNCAE